MKAFAGKVVWITGAAGGFGSAASRMFAADGALLGLFDLDGQGLNRLADALRAAAGQVELEPLDISDRAAVDAATARLLALWGRVDILVNLTGAYNMVRAALPPMREQKDGLIINVSSGAGKIVTSALPGVAYTAAKHGLNGLSHSISKEEAANGIRATALMPGEANTPWGQRRSGTTSYTEDEKTRLVQPEDVVAAMRFLAMLPPRVTVPEMPLNPTDKVIKPHHLFSA